MKSLFRLQVVTVALVAVLGFGACDDDDGPTGTGGDITAPTISSAEATDSNHVNLRFSEPVDRTSAQEEANYTITATGAAGAAVTVVNASLMADSRTVVLTTTALSAIGYVVGVQNVQDANGNAISSTVERPFTGSVTPDQTPPVIVMQTPAENAANVETTVPLEIQFSEPVPAGVFNTAFTLSANGTDVPVNVTSTDDVHYTIQPLVPLEPGTIYTVTLTGVEDAASNVMQDTGWTFRTTNSPSGTVTSVR